MDREIRNRMDIHGKIVKELLSYQGTEAFVSMYPSKSAVSLWCANEEQSFESMEALFGNAVIAGRRLIEIWDEVTLETLF